MAQQISLVATINTITRSGTCEITGHRYSVSIPLAQFAAWVKGQPIQEAMPQLSKEQREFFLSSTTPAEWADLFHRCEVCGAKGAMGLCRACGEAWKTHSDDYDQEAQATPLQFTRELAICAVDLTRSCAEHELYLPWLQLHTVTLNGSAGIAHYLFLAAVAFEEQAHRQVSGSCDPYVARETFADILMVSQPLSCEELGAAALSAIRDASDIDVPVEQHAALCSALRMNKGIQERGEARK